MKIHSLSNKKITSPVFKAKEYAIAKTLCKGNIVPLKIFEVNDADTCFLDLMASRIRLSKLSMFKNASLEQLKQWKNCLNNAILLVGFNEPQKSFLLTTEHNKPCGIITYKNFLNECQLDYLVSWPAKKNNKVKFAGTTLMKVMFDDVLKTDARSISLTTMHNSPVDLVKYYSNLSFKPVGVYPYGVDMVSSRTDFTSRSKDLNKLVELVKIQNSKNINLNKLLDITF